MPFTGYHVRFHRNSHIKSTTESACSFVEKVIMEFIVITAHTNKIFFTISNSVFNKKNSKNKSCRFLNFLSDKCNFKCFIQHFPSSSPFQQLSQLAAIVNVEGAYFDFIREFSDNIILTLTNLSMMRYSYQLENSSYKIPRPRFRTASTFHLPNTRNLLIPLFSSRDRISAVKWLVLKFLVKGRFIYWPSVVVSNLLLSFFQPEFIFARHYLSFPCNLFYCGILVKMLSAVQWSMFIEKLNTS